MKFNENDILIPNRETEAYRFTDILQFVVRKSNDKLFLFPVLFGMAIDNTNYAIELTNENINVYKKVGELNETIQSV